MIQSLPSYIDKYSRNKLLFVQGVIEGVYFIDIGLQLSSYIETIMDKRNLSMLVEDKLNSIISAETQTIELGDLVAIRNIGILFEPELKLDLHSKLDQWSRDRILIVNLEGSIVNDIFYLGKGTNPAYSCSLKNITYKTIYDNL